MVFRKSEAIESLRLSKNRRDNLNYTKPDNDLEGDMEKWRYKKSKAIPKQLYYLILQLQYW